VIDSSVGWASEVWALSDSAFEAKVTEVPCVAGGVTGGVAGGLFPDGGAAVSSPPPQAESASAASRPRQRTRIVMKPDFLSCQRGGWE